MATARAIATRCCSPARELLTVLSAFVLSMDITKQVVGGRLLVFGDFVLGNAHGDKHVLNRCHVQDQVIALKDHAHLVAAVILISYTADIHALEQNLAAP